MSRLTGRMATMMKPLGVMLSFAMFFTVSAVVLLAPPSVYSAEAGPSPQPHRHACGSWTPIHLCPDSPATALNHSPCGVFSCNQWNTTSCSGWVSSYGCYERRGPW